jgi:hypothetical protein
LRPANDADFDALAADSDATRAALDNALNATELRARAARGLASVTGASSPSNVPRSPTNRTLTPLSLRTGGADANLAANANANSGTLTGRVQDGDTQGTARLAINDNNVNADLSGTTTANDGRTRLNGGATGSVDTQGRTTGHIDGRVEHRSTDGDTRTTADGTVDVDADGSVRADANLNRSDRSGPGGMNRTDHRLGVDFDANNATNRSSLDVRAHRGSETRDGGDTIRNATDASASLNTDGDANVSLGHRREVRGGGSATTVGGDTRLEHRSDGSARAEVNGTYTSRDGVLRNLRVSASGTRSATGDRRGEIEADADLNIPAGNTRTTVDANAGLTTTDHWIRTVGRTTVSANDGDYNLDYGVDHSTRGTSGHVGVSHNRTLDNGDRLDGSVRASGNHSGNVTVDANAGYTSGSGVVRDARTTLRFGRTSNGSTLTGSGSTTLGERTDGLGSTNLSFGVDANRVTGRASHRLTTESGVTADSDLEVTHRTTGTGTTTSARFESRVNLDADTRISGNLTGDSAGNIAGALSVDADDCVDVNVSANSAGSISADAEICVDDDTAVNGSVRANPNGTINATLGGRTRIENVDLDGEGRATLTRGEGGRDLSELGVRARARRHAHEVRADLSHRENEIRAELHHSYTRVDLRTNAEADVSVTPDRLTTAGEFSHEVRRDGRHERHRLRSEAHNDGFSFVGERTVRGSGPDGATTNHVDGELRIGRDNTRMRVNHHEDLGGGNRLSAGVGANLRGLGNGEGEISTTVTSSGGGLLDARFSGSLDSVGGHLTMAHDILDGAASLAFHVSGRRSVDDGVTLTRNENGAPAERPHRVRAHRKVDMGISGGGTFYVGTLGMGGGATAGKVERIEASVLRPEAELAALQADKGKALIELGRQFIEDPDKMQVGDEVSFMKSGRMGGAFDLSLIGVRGSAGGILEGTFAVTLKKTGPNQLDVVVTPQKLRGLQVDGRLVLAEVAFSHVDVKASASHWRIDLSHPGGKKMLHKALAGKKMTRKAKKRMLGKKKNDLEEKGAVALGVEKEKLTETGWSLGLDWALIEMGMGRKRIRHKHEVLTGDSRRVETVRGDEMRYSAFWTGKERRGAYVTKVETTQLGEDGKPVSSEMSLAIFARYADTNIRKDEINTEIISNLNEQMGLNLNKMTLDGQHEKLVVDVRNAVTMEDLRTLATIGRAELREAAEEFYMVPLDVFSFRNKLHAAQDDDERISLLQEFVVQHSTPALGVLRKLLDLPPPEFTVHSNLVEDVRQDVEKYLAGPGRKALSSLTKKGDMRTRFEAAWEALERATLALERARENPLLDEEARADWESRLQEQVDRLNGSIDLGQLSPEQRTAWKEELNSFWTRSTDQKILDALNALPAPQGSSDGAVESGNP